MPKQKQTIYLAYGSNLNLPQMAMRCPTAEVIGPTELRGYELKFRGDDGHAVATVEPGNDSVPALLWTLKLQDEAALDRYEGWPRFYRKEQIEVILGNVTAMMYVMNDGFDLGRPSMWYYQTICDGYESAGFNLSVLHDALERSQPELNPLLEAEPQFGLNW